ncbi:MAG TPA: DNA-directed RNA polymerase subunit alpha [Synergistaceae bacterium]|jgi:DNA-directed RNA polymerase subunit alpha|nr:DNA-directed RNA polymerase subunit alpha [Synergistaceae bacterium]HPX03717.1 DNA-directed RNA polymerase subunit alpha [Synergistaceae bacterium]HQA54615.1 DNA-directed RNA polymerase subunit alpha [Synergistaceae bacterium]
MEHDRHEIIVQESTPSYGKITIEPLEIGYGVTLGNSLRRVLLSSISGAAIVAVRIEGVLHEFSTVPGVKEDVIELLVNLKHIPVRCHSSAVTTLRLEAKGPKTVTAADIEPDSEVEFPDPEAYICTLEEGASIVMDLYVGTGTGYLPIDRPRASYLPVDALQTDALYSPVKRVKYSIQDKRMGQRTDYDSLTLEIWTNGAVSPESAVIQASRILKGYYSSIVDSLAGPGSSALEDMIKGEENTKTVSGASGIERQPVMAGFPMGENSIYSRPVRDLELSVRSENCLLRGGVHVIGELISRTREDLLKIRNLGKISLREIEEKLAKFDLTLSGDVSTPIDDIVKTNEEKQKEEI